MPITEKDLPTMIADALDAVLDGLRSFVGRFGQALSLEELTARLEPLVDDMLASFAELAQAVPAPDEKFLAPAGAPAEPDQLSAEDFAAEVARLVREGWDADLEAVFGALPAAIPPVPGVAPPAPAAPAPGAPAPPKGLGGNLLAVIGAFAPLGDPEIWIRFGMELRGKMTGKDAARRVARDVIDAAKDAARAWSAGWPDDVPLTDEEKEAVEPDVGLPEWIGEWIDAVVSQIPGATAPTDARVGRDVHRAVITHYASTHPDRVVVCDGLVRVVDDKIAVRISQLWTSKGAPLQPTATFPKLERFRDVMRDPAGSVIRPDIADLDDPPTGPRDNFGWFEIKPMSDLREAVEEIYAYYLKTWNTAVGADPAWRGVPGVWQPETIFVTPKYKYLFAAVTVVPGAIGYLSYKLAEDAEIAVLVAMAALANLLLNRLIMAGRRTLEEAEVAAAYLAEFLAAWVIVLVVLLLIAMAAIALLPEIAVADLIGVATAACAKLAQLMSALG
jgi:hypothetical protein